VKAETFHFEIKDLITQFVSAFDDIIIKRYNAQREEQQKIQVRYVYAPKQRVIYDLVNKAQNLTVPVVAVNITSVRRDEARVFNKVGGFYYPGVAQDKYSSPKTNFFRAPVPVNIDVAVSVITKFQSDMDQIISNFVPYSNPYIILSWKLPESLLISGSTKKIEIRSEVLWNENITLNYPTDINSSDKYRVTGDTGFTIKGWLFPAESTSRAINNIFYIDTNFTGVSAMPASLIDTTGYETDTVGLSGYPEITNIDLETGVI